MRPDGDRTDGGLPDGGLMHGGRPEAAGRDRPGEDRRAVGPALRISILTGFPRMFEGPFEEGMLRVARESGRVEIRVENLREFTDDPHRSIDDYPYGGGPGMILKVEPVVRALESLPPALEGRREVVLLSPQGERLTQRLVRRLLEAGDVVLVMGRYKGLDERIRAFVTREVSVGDFILSGGEPGAMVVADAMARLVPGVLGDMESALSDSFETGLLDCAYYTRPEEYRGLRVPRWLLTGNHGRIRAERRRDALRRTLKRRPDLLEMAPLTRAEARWLREQGWEPPAGVKAGALDEETGAGRLRTPKDDPRSEDENHGRAEEH